MLSDFRNTEKPVEYHDDAVEYKQKETVFLIYPHTHKRFVQEMQKFIDINDELLQEGGMDEEFMQKKNECTGEYLIKKWKNFKIKVDHFNEDFPDVDTSEFKKDDDGQFRIPFSKKMAKMIMTHKHYKGFQKWVFRMASNRGNYVAKKEAEDAKNS